VFFGGAAFIVGHILLAFPQEGALYAALAFLIIGNGLFKPNISTMVGRLYPEGSPLKDAGYTFFYMGINLGAFTCNFVAAIVRNAYGWHWAFATAGFGMLAGLIIFALGQKHLRAADITDEERTARGPQPSLTPLWVQCLGPAVALGAVGYVIGDGPNWLNLGPTTNRVRAGLPAGDLVLRRHVARAHRHRRARQGRRAARGVRRGGGVLDGVSIRTRPRSTSGRSPRPNREPSGLIEPVIGLADDFAERAPPAYFKNAPASTPRPADATFRIVSDAEYAALKEAKQLSVRSGVPTPVTQAIYDQVMAKATPETPRLAPGVQHRLVNTELFGSINGGFVLLLAPLMVALWAFLRRRGTEPSSAGKIALGLSISALSITIMIAAAATAGGEKVSAWWLFGTYGVITIGELCLSPMGLSMVSKHAPRRLAGFLMGGWFLASAIGNKLSGVAGELYYTTDHVTFFIGNAAAVGGAALIITLMVPWLRRQFGEDRPASVDVPEAQARVRR
jgi:POT family proton-dependent oligopeptide transporter